MTERRGAKFPSLKELGQKDSHRIDGSGFIVASIDPQQVRSLGDHLGISQRFDALTNAGFSLIAASLSYVIGTNRKLGKAPVMEEGFIHNEEIKAAVAKSNSRKKQEGYRNGVNLVRLAKEATVFSHAEGTKPTKAVGSITDTMILPPFHGSGALQRNVWELVGNSFGGQEPVKELQVRTEQEGQETRVWVAAGLHTEEAKVRDVMAITIFENSESSDLAAWAAVTRIRDGFPTTKQKDPFDDLPRFTEVLNIEKILNNASPYL